MVGDFWCMSLNHYQRMWSTRYHFFPTKLECERHIDSIFRMELGNNRLPYEVWILDQRRSERVFRGKFGTKSWEIQDEHELRKDRKVLGFGKLEATVPDVRVYLTIQEIIDGKLFSLIDQLTFEWRKWARSSAWKSIWPALRGPRVQIPSRPP